MFKGQQLVRDDGVDGAHEGVVLRVRKYDRHAHSQEVVSHGGGDVGRRSWTCAALAGACWVCGCLKWDEYIVEVPPEYAVAAQQARPSIGFIRVIMFSPPVIDSRFWWLCSNGQAGT